MYCEHCGVKKEDGAIFCHSCGKKAETVSDHTNVEDAVVTNDSPILDGKDIFYSKEWRLKNFFAISSLPKLDVLIENDTLYLIKLPNYSGSTTGGIIGFFVGSIIGAAIGASIGESSDRKKREWYRSAWIDSEGKLISREYTRDIYIETPLSVLKNNVSFNKSKVFLNINGKKITLGRRPRSFQSPDRTERNRINEQLKNYVL